MPGRPCYHSCTFVSVFFFVAVAAVVVAAAVVAVVVAFWSFVPLFLFIFSLFLLFEKAIGETLPTEMPDSEEEAAAAAAAAIAAAPKQSWSGQGFVRSHAVAARWASMVSIPEEAKKHVHCHTLNDSDYTALFDGASAGGGSSANQSTAAAAAAFADDANSKRSRAFAGWERRDTGVRAATSSLASVHVVR